MASSLSDDRNLSYVIDIDLHRMFQRGQHRISMSLQNNPVARVKLLRHLEHC
jgi:hypothetical protein